MHLIGATLAVLLGVIIVEAMPAGNVMPAAGIAPKVLMLPRDIDEGPSLPQTTAWAGILLGRPLFAVSRRPPFTASQLPQPEELPRLAGIMRSDSNTIVIFQEKDRGKSLVMGVGSDVAGWTIARVLGSSVILRKNGETREVHLTFGNVINVAATTVARTILATRRTDPFLAP